jgi:hypothetical protein
MLRIYFIVIIFTNIVVTIIITTENMKILTNQNRRSAAGHRAHAQQIPLLTYMSDTNRTSTITVSEQWYV